jgi:hypothetical protein
MLRVRGVRHDAVMDTPGPAPQPAAGDAVSSSGPRRPGRTARPLLVLAWLAATALGGVITWSAVTVVAGARGDAAPGVVSQAAVTAQLADATAGVPADGSTTPSPSGTAAPPATGPTPTADPAVTPAPAPAPAPATAAEVARTWDVTGGQVAAACAGSAIRLLYATPTDGWTVLVEGTGPQEVDVRFTRDGARTRVRAECVAGTPESRSTTDDGGGGGGDDSGGGGDD